MDVKIDDKNNVENKINIKYFYKYVNECFTYSNFDFQSIGNAIFFKYTPYTKDVNNKKILKPEYDFFKTMADNNFFVIMYDMDEKQKYDEFFRNIFKKEFLLEIKNNNPLLKTTNDKTYKTLQQPLNVEDNNEQLNEIKKYLEKRNILTIIFKKLKTIWIKIKTIFKKQTSLIDNDEQSKLVKNLPSSYNNTFNSKTVKNINDLEPTNSTKTISLTKNL